MEIRHIRYFLAICEDMSFTKAAKRLNMAQPPLSRQIQDLEEELGTPLFIRQARGVQLTDAGLHFLQYAHQITQLVDKSKEELQHLDHTLNGMIYIAFVEGQAPHLISQWIAGFHKLFSNVRYHLWSGSSDDVLERLQNELADLALIVEPYDQEHFEGLQVYQEPWIAMIPENHPLTKLPGTTITVRDLSPYELIIPSRQSRILEIEHWFDSYGVQPKIICELSQMLNAYELVAQNVGISIYPAAAAAYVTHPGIQTRTIVEPYVTASYVLLRHKEHPMNPAARKFYAYVKQQTQTAAAGFSEK
jgi:DNA-binding transcriptional LysR family regulator